MSDGQVIFAPILPLGPLNFTYGLLIPSVDDTGSACTVKELACDQLVLPFSVQYAFV